MATYLSILTDSTSKFLAGQSAEQPQLHSLLEIENFDGIYHDRDEWDRPWVRGNSILHIELRRWAAILIVAPLSANSLAKMTIGMADDLLLSIIRAWDTTREIEHPSRRNMIVVAPAMNTAMWRHPVTKQHIKKLEEGWGISGGSDGWTEVLRPLQKSLVCGDVGDGAMKGWKEIVSLIEARLELDN